MAIYLSHYKVKGPLKLNKITNTSVIAVIIISELRKQARLLENDIDVKLVGFSKLGISPSTSRLSSEAVPLINSDDMFDTMSMEIQQLLNKVRKETYKTG